MRVYRMTIKDATALLAVPKFGDVECVLAARLVSAAHALQDVPLSKESPCLSEAASGECPTCEQTVEPSKCCFWCVAGECWRKNPLAPYNCQSFLLAALPKENPAHGPLSAANEAYQSHKQSLATPEAA